MNDINVNGINNVSRMTADDDEFDKFTHSGAVRYIPVFQFNLNVFFPAKIKTVNMTNSCYFQGAQKGKENARIFLVQLEDS